MSYMSSYLSGLNQYFPSQHTLSITLNENTYLGIYEPIVEYRHIDTPETCRPLYPISQQVLKQPSLEIVEICSTYFGAMTIGMAKAALMRKQHEQKGIRDTHTDDDDSGLGILMPVRV